MKMMKDDESKLLNVVKQFKIQKEIDNLQKKLIELQKVEITHDEYVKFMNLYNKNFELIEYMIKNEEYFTLLNNLQIRKLKNLCIRIIAADYYYYDENYDNIEIIKNYILNDCKRMSDKTLNNYLANYNLKFDIINKDIDCIGESGDKVDMIKYIIDKYPLISDSPEIKEIGMFLLQQSQNDD